MKKEEEQTVAFLSSSGRGLSEDLKLVKNALESCEQMKFRYFFRNTTIGKGTAKRSVATAKKQFCKVEQHYISIDASVPRNLKGKEDYQRILLLTPYDYIFKTEEISAKEKGKFQGYTHIICGSPFVQKNLEKNYHVDGIKLIGDCSLPSALRMEEREQRERIREKIEFFFPASKGKKIISLLIMGTIPVEEEADEENEEETGYPFYPFFANLPEEYFILVNNAVVLEGLNSSFLDRVGYVKNMMPASDLLYATDVLCTDSGQLGTTFLNHKDGELFVFSMIKNSFSKYIQKEYPSMAVSDAEELVRLISLPKEYKAELNRLRQEFCYPKTGNVYQIVKEILADA